MEHMQYPAKHFHERTTNFYLEMCTSTAVKGKNN